MKKTEELQHACGLLMLRVLTGGMLLGGHGLNKLLTYSTQAASFPDPLGVGPSFSMALAIFAEAICSLLVMLGLLTRAATVPIIITMLVALIFVHAGDPWVKKELALLYLVPNAAIALLGPGPFSLDSWLGRHRKTHVKFDSRKV